MKKLTFLLVLLFLINFKLLAQQFSLSISDTPDPSAGVPYDVEVTAGLNASTPGTIYVDVSLEHGVAGVQLLSSTGFTNVYSYAPGTTINTSNGGTMSSVYYLLSGVRIGPYSGLDLKFKFRVTPNQSGTFKIKYRATLITTSGNVRYPTGTSGCGTDQQGWRVLCENHTHSGWPAKPDLKGVNAEILESPIYAGVPVTFRATIQEMNSVAINTQFTYRCYVDNDWVAYKYFTSFAGGDVYSGDHSCTFPVPGSYTIKVIADYGNYIDESNETNNEYSRTITVVSQNQSPSVTISAPQINGTNVTLSWAGTDPNGGALTYRYKLDSDSWSGWSSTVNKTYNGLSTGQHTFYVEIKDDVGATGSDSKTFTIQGQQNQAPTVNISTPIVSGTNVTINWSGNDPEGGALVYRHKLDNDSWATWDNYRAVSYSNQSPGSHTIYVEVKDPEGLTGSANRTFTLQGQNQPPVLANIGSKNVDEGLMLSFNISAYDPEGSNLTFTVQNLPTGASFNANNQQFSWVPGYDQAGSYTVRFTVTDDGGLNDYEEVSITVNNVTSGQTVSFWPHSNDTINVVIPQDRSFEVKVYIGAQHNISNLKIKYWSTIAGGDLFTLKVQKPDGTNSTTSSSPSYTFPQSSPAVGWWTFTVNASNVTNGSVRLAIALTSTFVNDAPILYYKPSLLSDNQLSTASVKWGLMTGVCDIDDYACMGADLTVGITPVLGTAKDITQFVSSAVIGSGYYVQAIVRDDPQSVVQAKRYFTSAGWAGFGLGATLFGAYYVDDVAKSAKYLPEIAEGLKHAKKVKVLGSVAELPASLKRYSEIGHLEIVDNVKSKPFLDLMADLKAAGLQNPVNKGLYNENMVRAKLISDPSGRYEAHIAYSGQTPGSSAKIFAKEVSPGVFDESTAYFGSTGSSTYKLFTDADVIVKDIMSGKFVIVQVKSTASTSASALAENKKQIQKIKDAINMSTDPRMLPYKGNTDVWGAMMGDMSVHPLVNGIVETTDSTYIHDLATSPCFIDSIVSVGTTVRVYFYTLTENSNSGFYVYRINPNDTTVAYRVSPLIPGALSSTTPVSYSFIDQFAAINNKYRYFIMQQHISGYEIWSSDTIQVIHGTVGVDGIKSVAVKYDLCTAYPNPFNPETRITFELPEAGNTSLTVYDMLGNKVDELISGYYTTGQHNVTWMPKDLSSGAYLVVMRTEKFSATQKVMYLK